MKKSDVTYVLCTVFAAATSVFYCCTRWFQIQLPRYYPLEHAWKWAKDPGAPSQAWYAMQAFAFICGGIATLAVYIVLKRTAQKKTELGLSEVRWLGVAATVLIMVCMAYLLICEFSEWRVF
jgi:ABC-type Fe3+-siderophore transport system permease subunit